MNKPELNIKFQLIDDQLNLAYETNNVHKIAALLSDDWLILEPSIGIRTKSQFLEAIKCGRLSHGKMKKEVYEVKLQNEIAIVITRGMNIGMYLDQFFESEQWVTNIYRSSPSGWLCILTQEAPCSFH